MLNPPSTFEEAISRSRFEAGREGQRDVFEAFRAGRHVILHAPTGWGKTFSVVAALGRGHTIYSLPLRALVESLVNDANKSGLRRCVAQHGARREHPFLDPGDNPNDPVGCVFTTLDQSLSAFLGIPVGVSIRQGNILPAVVDASHLVFDEFHLFDPSRSWTTALFALLSSRQNGIVLTATLSDPMITFLVQTLGACDQGVELIQAKRPFVNTKEILPGQGFADLSRLPLGDRTIIIRNQIEWAKHTAKELRASYNDRPIYLLHSELLPHHRTEHEMNVRSVFGKTECGPAVLVSTQVIEAGIDLTCDVMHTDLCPPSSFVQRAGRCARFEGEEGRVYWHPVESVNPYRGAESEIESLATFLRSCTILSPHAEGSIIQISADADRAAITNFASRNLQEVARSRIDRDYASYGDMIRRIESINVAIGISPERPYHFLSMSPGKFYGSGPYANIPVSPVRVDFDRKIRQRTTTTTESIGQADFVLLDPESIAYDPNYGLSPGETGGEDCFLNQAPKTRSTYRYTGHAEPYGLHLERLLQQRPICEWMLKRIEVVFIESGASTNIAAEMASYLADFIIWTHDLGKLDRKWQAAHGVMEGRAPHPVAHSGELDFPRIRQPPPHAWVSAWSVREFLWTYLFSKQPKLARPVFWAIADHHGYSGEMQHQSLYAYQLGFLDYLDEMSTLRDWDHRDWDRSILTTSVRDTDLDDIHIFMRKQRLRTDDHHEIYYMLSYILRRSDQLATALVTTVTEESIDHPQNSSIL